MTSSIWLRSERSDYPWLIHHTLSAVDAGPARKCVLGFAVFVTLLTATYRQDYRFNPKLYVLSRAYPLGCHNVIWAHKVVVAAHVLVGPWELATHNGGPYQLIVLHFLSAKTSTRRTTGMVTGRCFRSKRLGVSCWTRGYAWRLHLQSVTLRAFSVHRRP